ncbi:MAG: thiolase family protein [Elusimicrobiota bacterium]
MKAQDQKIVICGGMRTPIGHFARSLANYSASELMRLAVESTIKKVGVKKEDVDGLFVGWVGQDFNAPNLARVTLLNSGLPEKAQAATLQNNCISSIEAVSMAARCILAGEGSLYIAGGTEAMSRLPYSISGSRAADELRSFDVVKEKWGELIGNDNVTVVDAMEQGLTDPVKGINMAATAEVCAQLRGISREDQDNFAYQSFKRSVEGWEAGFYNDHVEPIKDGDTVILDKDEYPHLRINLVKKPKMFSKSPALFDNSKYPIADFFRDFGKFMDGKSSPNGNCGTVTLFNACGRSDGAAAIVVTTEARAKELGLPIAAELKSWGYYGNDPAHMGVSPALATPVALERAGIQFADLDQIELHEPFAATVLGIFKDGKEKFGHDWQAKYDSGALNPNGGSISIGHPLGATGIRLVLNLLESLKRNDKSRLGLAAACAGGGMGGALVVEKLA